MADAFAGCLAAQTLSLGLSAGVPLTRPVRGGGRQWFAAGPAVEVSVTRATRAGAALLYGASSLSAGATARFWEVPVSLAYSFTTVPAQPFLRVGAAFHRVLTIGGAEECARGPFGERFYCVNGGPIAELRHRTTYGPLAGAGVTFRAGRVRIAPEIRLTRWVDRSFGVRDAALRSNLLRVELLAGFLF